MDTNLPENLHELGYAAYGVFLWPGNFLLSQIGAHAPDVAMKLGIGIEGNGIVLTTIVAALVWSLFGFAAWKTLRFVAAQTLYVGRRLRTLLIGKVQKANRRRILSRPVSVPDVEFDELDIAVLNTGMTLPPGLALTAAELSGQLTGRPAEIQRSLEKLRKYGLLDDAIGETDGFDNYRLSQSGAALMSMWHRQARAVH